MIDHVQSEATTSSPGSHLQTSGSSAQQQARAQRWAQRWARWAGAKALWAVGCFM